MTNESRPQRFVCPEHGYGVKGDEDGCCATCGADCAVVEVIQEPEAMVPRPRKPRELQPVALAIGNPTEGLGDDEPEKTR